MRAPGKLLVQEAGLCSWRGSARRFGGMAAEEVDILGWRLDAEKRPMEDSENAE